MSKRTPYTLVRSNRRTLSLVVERNGSLVARAPRRMPTADIEAFIAKKSQWIVQKQALQRARDASAPTLADGGLLPFRGGSLILRLAEVRVAAEDHGTLLIPHRSPPHKALKAWLLGQAQALLPPLVARQGETMELQPSALRFSTPRTRWGSMNSKGVMMLNAALLLCPPSLAEYVIIHELAHLRQPNHSPAFWSLVERWAPDYRERRNWLKQHQGVLRILEG
ncbi:MAG: M48 family metallopeptidase [Clostridia bacterium]|nr:M48 family metallopeptidase [Clostridia bacterium]